MKYTKPTRISVINPQWHLIDVDNKVLGRISTEIARLLIGKNKAVFTSHLHMGDSVVVINSTRVKVTGNKKNQKEYTNYSGYPSGLKTEKFSSLQKRRPNEIIRHAVSGMLPKNKLRKRMLSRLFIFPDDVHPYTDKLNSGGAEKIRTEV